MAKEQQEALEKILTASLTRTIDFTKFAEAKNAALLTFSSAWALAIVSAMVNGRGIPLGYQTTSSISLLLLIGSILIAITSFLPKIKLSNFLKTDHRASNLLFFGDVSALKIPDFEAQVRDRYMPPETEPFNAAYITDLTHQVAVNSIIATQKFRRFNRGLAVAIVAITVLVSPALIHVAVLIRGWLS